MNRRQFLSMAGALAGYAGDAFGLARWNASSPIKSLVLVDLDGGNDSLNTVIPYVDPLYRTLRPTLALPRNRVVALDESTALHPSLAPLMSAWRANELAIVRGVGYHARNRSHYRSWQIWNTASHADEYRRDAWIEGISVESFDEAARSIATRGATVVLVTLHGFDTHANQAQRHAALLARLARGLTSLRAASIASGVWNGTLVMTRSEFGRAAQENADGGTDHGAAAAHFLMGGSVRGGLFGAPPRLDQLDANGGLTVDIDFRTLYATAFDALNASST